MHYIIITIHPHDSSPSSIPACCTSSPYPSPPLFVCRRRINDIVLLNWWFRDDVPSLPSKQEQPRWRRKDVSTADHNPEGHTQTNNTDNKGPCPNSWQSNHIKRNSLDRTLQHQKTSQSLAAGEIRLRDACDEWEGEEDDDEQQQLLYYYIIQGRYSTPVTFWCPFISILQNLQQIFLWVKEIWTRYGQQVNKSIQCLPLCRLIWRFVLPLLLFPLKYANRMGER